MDCFVEGKRDTEAELTVIEIEKLSGLVIKNKKGLNCAVIE